MTNSVDQLKTRIQFGQFKHLGTAFRWQAKSKAEGGGGGLGKLFGRAAVIRAFYIGHGCMVSIKTLVSVPLAYFKPSIVEARQLGQEMLHLNCYRFC